MAFARPFMRGFDRALLWPSLGVCNATRDFLEIY